MNQYLNNIAAKNLHQMEVIQPRLASRFEPTPNHILPAHRSLQSSVSGDDGPLSVSDIFAQDQDAPNHYASDRYARVTARKIAGSSPPLVAGDPDSHGHETIDGTEGAKAAGRQSQPNKDLSPISEMKKLFSSSGQSRSDISAIQPSSLETVDLMPSPPAGTTSESSSIFASSEVSSSHQVTKEPRMVLKVIEQARLEHQLSLEETKPLTPVEEKQVNAEKKPNHKALDRPTLENMRPEEEIVPLASVEENKKRRDTEYGIRLKTREPIASMKPFPPSFSPGMVVARPHVNRYSRPERNEMLDKVAKPETSVPVQVTIGRIEIKATPATAASQRKRAEPPVMSLQDYLKIKRGSL